ncbi:hypothetical protein [uncultured Gammaproteobacteria bacterium]|nr:hypothetical protein [uncultured Gammaproteobacteria bacterium]
MIIYLDESGDLGFDFTNKKPSKKFVIILLVCKDKSAADSFGYAVKRTLKNKLNHKKTNNRNTEELHATKDSISTKKYFYRRIKSTNWEIYTAILNKTKIYNHLTTKSGRKKLYNFLAHYLLEKVDLSKVNSAVTLVVDKCKNKAEIEDFNQYLVAKLEGKLPLNLPPLLISHEDSKSNTGIQSVDYFCWGVYRKYEHQDLEWYECFKDKILIEQKYL